MRTGFVKWFNHRKGYGFIRYVDETGSWHEVFVHKSNLNFSPKDGDFVSFLIRDGWKGPQAVNVNKGRKLSEVT